MQRCTDKHTWSLNTPFSRKFLEKFTVPSWAKKSEISWKLKVHYHTQKRPPICPIQKQSVVFCTPLPLYLWGIFLIFIEFNSNGLRCADFQSMRQCLNNGIFIVIITPPTTLSSSTLLYNHNVWCQINCESEELCVLHSRIRGASNILTWRFSLRTFSIFSFSLPPPLPPALSLSVWSKYSSQYPTLENTNLLRSVIERETDFTPMYIKRKSYSLVYCNYIVSHVLHNQYKTGELSNMQDKDSRPGNSFIVFILYLSNSQKTHSQTREAGYESNNFSF